MSRCCALAVVFCLWLVGQSVPGSAAEADELVVLGLPPDTGRDKVEIYCGACHSLKLVVQQGLSRRDWDELLVYMIEEHEMEPLETDDRKLVLDYLAKHVSIEVRRKKRKP